MKYYHNMGKKIFRFLLLNETLCIAGEIPRGFRFHCQAASKYKGIGIRGTEGVQPC